MINVTATGFSIGTGLALETFTPQRHDSGRNVPTPIRPLEYYSTIYVNILTLIRNAIQAVPATDFPKLRTVDIASLCKGEMHLLPEFLNITDAQSVVYYMSRHTPLHQPGLSERLRQANTEKQKRVEYLIGSSSRAIIASEKVSLVSWKVQSTRNNALMLTHLVPDLYSYTNFKSLTLLESNTGLTKLPHMFASKYFNLPAEVTPFIPFEPKTGLVLGDNYVVKPAPTKFRKQFIAAALANRWNASTSSRKIDNELNRPEYELAHQFYTALPSFS